MSEAMTIIFSYTRAQAIDDGVLIDITQMAREAGIRYPVTITERLYHEYIVPSLDLAKQGQSIEGRLWDTLMVFRHAASGTAGNLIHFDVLFQTSRTDSSKPVLATIHLKALCHGGDQGEPVITIMLPEED
jgi:hypothetical protein